MRWVIAWPCLLHPSSLGRPTREVREINGSHSCSLPHGCPLSTEGCLMKVVLGSSGGSKTPIVPCPSLSQATVKWLLWHTKKAIGFHDLVEKRCSPTRSIVAMIDTGYAISVSWLILSAAWPLGDPYRDNYQSLNRDHDMEFVCNLEYRLLVWVVLFFKMVSSNDSTKRLIMQNKFETIRSYS